MLAFIKGNLAEIEESKLILERDGIGYELFTPMNAQTDRLYPGQELKIYTHLHVREDALQLYGFLTKDDLTIFRLLLGVSGIGPKAALGILSAISPDELRFAVLAEDIKTISKAPGIGRKTAQKLVLELKDKLNLQDAFQQKLEHVKEEAGNLSVGDARQEAAEALTALGYGSTEALRAVRKVDGWEDMDVETLLKAALKNM
ncbi:MAG: Holliday junction branch migration protein RuvA [Blautia sp.]